MRVELNTWLGAVVIQGSFNLWLQDDESFLCQARYRIKVVQASQTLSEFGSIVMKVSNRCSTFTSPDLIHRDSSKLGLFGSMTTDIRVK